MKNRYTLLSIILFLTLASLVNIAQAQVTPGQPSSPATPPPTSATGISKILCSGTNISLTGPTDPNNGNAPFAAYKWYKLDASNTPQLTTQVGQTYTETPTTSGYFSYQVVTVNANGCESPSSDVFKILVLPPLSVSITTPNTGTVCSGVTDPSAVLTAATNPESAGYDLTYQWTLNGNPISGAINSTYTVPATTVTTNTVETYGVNVTYALNNTCPATATKSITVIPLPSKPSITAN